MIYSSPPDTAPFRITFETALGERMGIVAYAFLANARLTRNRPDDEHRFQIKYGSKDGRLHELWQDPYGLYTTLLIGINPEQGFFVAADPMLHSPTRFFISIEFKQQHADAILKNGWFAWERARRSISHDPVEVLVGGAADSFLRLARFEREALGEDQGHRQLLAERFSRGEYPVVSPPGDRERVVEPERVHALSREFELSESEVLDLIGQAPRLKMAVRGWGGGRASRAHDSSGRRCEPLRTFERGGWSRCRASISGPGAHRRGVQERPAHVSGQREPLF